MAKSKKTIDDAVRAIQEHGGGKTEEENLGDQTLGDDSGDGGDGSGTGDGGEVKFKEVDLDEGIKIKLPEEEANKVIAKRTAKHQEQKALRDKLAQLEAQVANVAKTKQTDEENANTKKLVDKGEFDRVFKEATLKHQSELQAEREKLNKLGENLVNTELRGKLASMANLNLNEPAHKVVLDDALAVLRHQTKYNFDTGAIEIVDNTGSVMMDSDTGENMTADKFLSKFLTDRPYMVQKKVAKALQTGNTDKTIENKPRKTWGDAAKAAGLN